MSSELTRSRYGYPVRRRLSLATRCFERAPVSFESVRSHGHNLRAARQGCGRYSALSQCSRFSTFWCLTVRPCWVAEVRPCGLPRVDRLAPARTPAPTVGNSVGTYGFFCSERLGGRSRCAARATFGSSGPAASQACRRPGSAVIRGLAEFQERCALTTSSFRILVIPLPARRGGRLPWRRAGDTRTRAHAAIRSRADRTSGLHVSYYSSAAAGGLRMPERLRAACTV
jgi:hypothetical protein